MKKTVLFFIFPALLSCEKVIEFKGDEVAPLLVVNSVAQADTTMFLFISNSVFFLSDASPRPVPNATVLLTVNGEEKRVQSADDYYYSDASVYVSDYVPQQGDLLRYEISAPGYTSVWAESVVPQAVPILTTDTATFIEDNSNYLKCSLKFNDPPGKKNYYRILVFHKSREYDSYPIYSTVYSDDMALAGSGVEDIMGEGSSNEYQIFSDDLFDGKEYTLKFWFQPQHNVYYETDYHIVLQSISYEYYMYLRTSSVQSDYEDGMTLWAEPTQVYNNIHGGIGIFASASQSEQILHFDARQHLPY